MSALRARCPDCRTLTAVAIGPDYQCHSCGREFAAGLVRVPTAWGTGGETMAAAAYLELPWPEAAVVEEATLDDEIEVIGRTLPTRPFVLGGSCCAHVGAVRELVRRHGRTGVVWLDSHGDLNTPATTPSVPGTGPRVLPSTVIAAGRAVRKPNAAGGAALRVLASGLVA